MNPPDFRALCAELFEAWRKGVDLTGPMNHAYDILAKSFVGAKPLPPGYIDMDAECLSPKEIEAQQAFTEMRDEILNLSDPAEVNEVLRIIDNYTPEWV